MHHLYFVLIENNKNGATNSKSAREHAFMELEHHNFATCGGYWGGGECDWFVVGGRWSGLLNSGYEEFCKEVTIVRNRRKFLCTSLFPSKDYQKFWKLKGGKDLYPMQRNFYQKLGYTDDAKVLDQSIIELLNKRYEVDAYIPQALAEVPIAHIINNPNEYIGKYWIVVIDYHN